MTMRVRGFRDGDLEAVLELRSLVFRGLEETRERRRWRWEFEENPFRREDLPLTWVVEEGERIVGNFGMVPYAMKIGGAIGRAVDGIDLAVHPACQGRGLAHLLTDALMDPAGSDFAFVAAPTDATTHLFVQRGGIILGRKGEPLTWTCPLESEPTARTREEIEAAFASIELLIDFDERFDELWERLAPGFPLLTVRNRSYLNWRYRDYPFGKPHLLAASDRDGMLAGFAVVQEDLALSRAYLLELFAAPEDPATAKRLLLAARKIASRPGLRVLAVVTRLASMRRLLHESGFSELGEPIPVYAGKLNGARATPSVDEWYVSLGDGDALFSVGR
ncbi:MAG: GNAT family N-acetyltransferase [Planctomycetota bacterium]